MTLPSAERREAAVLQAILPNLQAEGFEVFLRPNRLALPPFLHGITPDAIALKPDRKLVIEILSKGERSQARLAKLQRLMSGHDDWELRVVHVPKGPLPSAPPIASETTVRETLARIPAVYDAAGPIPALLLAWSTFEAAARLVVPNDATWGMASTDLVDWLTYRGDITNDDADVLRPIAKLRDEAAHGGLDRTASSDTLAELVSVACAMLSASAELSP